MAGEPSAGGLKINSLARRTGVVKINSAFAATGEK
jgi:hypothetical protein